MSDNARGPLGPLWPLYEQMMVGRIVQTDKGRQGHIILEPYKDPEEPFRLMTRVRWSNGKVDDVQVSDLHQKGMLQPAFVEDQLLVHPKVLNLQRNNWADAKVVAEIHARSEYMLRSRKPAQGAAQGKPTPKQPAPKAPTPKDPKQPRRVDHRTSVDVEIIPTSPVAAPTAAQPAAAVAAQQGGRSASPTQRVVPTAPDPHPKAGQAAKPSAPKARKSTSPQESPVAADASKASPTPATTPAVSPAVARPTGPPPLPGSQQGPNILVAASTLMRMARTDGQAPAEQGKKRPLSLVAEDEEEPARRQKTAAKTTNQQVADSDEDLSHDTGEHFATAAASPAEESGPSGGGGDGPSTRKTRTTSNQQENYSDTSRWTRGWTGIYYPKDIVKRPGDISVAQGYDEAGGEYSWDTIMDKYTDAEGRQWVLLKWTGYELDPGKGRQYLRTDKDLEPHLRGHWELASDAFNKKQKKVFQSWLSGKQPEWYKRQLE